MPRKPRLHVPGGAYHVILRGNNREPLFFCRRDRDEWSELLAESLQRYGCSLHAYCWMTNHVHLLVQVAERPLGQMVQWAASQYARSLNKRKRRTGHLFERRYRALLVDVDEYLISLVKYIHLNPVAAGIVTIPGEFEFSSHRAYLGQCSNSWLTTDWVLSFLSPRRERAIEMYSRLFDEQAPHSTHLDVEAGTRLDNRILGQDSFVDDVIQRTVDTASVLRSLGEIIDEYCLRYGIEEAELASTSRIRRNAKIRAEIAITATSEGICTLADVARRFDRSQSGLCRSIRHLRKLGGE